MKYERYNLRGEIVRDLRFLNDDDQMKMTIGLMQIALKAMTLGVCLMKIASQKPYSPSPIAGSPRTTVLETCSPHRGCTLTNRMK
jgi:hypothetical protein